jgi:hypothetical protein
VHADTGALHVVHVDARGFRRSSPNAAGAVVGVAAERCRESAGRPRVGARYCAQVSTDGAACIGVHQVAVGVHGASVGANGRRFGRCRGRRATACTRLARLRKYYRFRSSGANRGVSEKPRFGALSLAVQTSRQQRANAREPRQMHVDATACTHRPPHPALSRPNRPIARSTDPRLSGPRARHRTPPAAGRPRHRRATACTPTLPTVSPPAGCGRYSPTTGHRASACTAPTVTAAGGRWRGRTPKPPYRGLTPCLTVVRTPPPVVRGGSPRRW